MHWFRKHRSTTTALLSAYDKWVRAANLGQVSGVILLDLSAAFDLVESGILLRKIWRRSRLVRMDQILLDKSQSSSMDRPCDFRLSAD